MAEVMYAKAGDMNPLLGFWVVSCLAVSGAVCGAVFCSSPILVPVVVEVVLGALFLYRPTAAIKLMLFSAGLPLSLFYQEVGYEGVTKPLFSEWGGTTPDGLRLILSCILLCVLLFKLEETRALLRRFWPYTVMLLFMACTLFHSPARVEGLRLFMKILFPFLFFLAVAQLVRSSQEINSYARYWIAGGIVASLCAPLIALVTGISFLYPAGLEFRLSPGYTSASSYSFYMVALFIYCYAQWRKRLSFGFAVLSGVFGVQAVLPLTRIAWAALLLGLVAFEFFYVKGKKKWLAAAAVGLPPVLILYALLWSIPTLHQRVFQSDEVDSDLPAIEQAQSIGLTGRGTTWLAGLEDYQQHNLLLGQGIGTSDRYFMTFFGTVAHNEYLRVLYDGGAVGLGLFIFANVSLLYQLIKVRSNANSTIRTYAAIGLALVIGYLVVAATDNPLDYYLLFSQYVFFVLGVCFALSREASALGDTGLGEGRA